MRAILIEDNEIDRMNLRILLEKHAEISIVGEASTLDSAIDLIGRENPDVLFLDIHLGRQKGFSILDQVDASPQIVITTSHPHYAIKGFDVDAVDYLLKPIMEEPLARAVHRLKSRKQLDPSQESARLDPGDIQVFKEGETIVLMPIEQILAITGERVYSHVLVRRDNKDYLHNRTLREWKDLLPERQFKAIDRSTIIHIGAIERISPNPRGNGSVVTFWDSTHRLEIGDTATKNLRHIL